MYTSPRPPCSDPRTSPGSKLSLRPVGDLDRALLDRDGERSRQELLASLGEYKVEADTREIHFYNEQGRHEAALLRAVGTDARNCGSGGPLLRMEECWIEVELR